MHHTDHHRVVRERIIASEIMKLELRQALERERTRHRTDRERGRPGTAVR